MLKSFFLSLVLISSVFFSHAQQPAQTAVQNRSELEKERAAIQKEIEEVKSSLDETKKNKKETLGQLTLLQRKLRLRESAIQNINSQINFIQGDMNDSWRQILKLRNELDTLRRQYAESVVYAYKNRSSYDFLNFIFSATSFNDAVRRVAYLKSYRAYREERADNISKTQLLLQSKIDGLKVSRQEKDDVLKKQNKEREILEVEKKEKDAVVSGLQSREKELKKEMNAKQKQDNILSSSIAAALRRARDLAIKEAKKKDAETRINATTAKAANPVGGNNASTNPVTAPSETKTKTYSVFKTSEDIRLSDNFEKNRGHLPWPVASGTIAMAFGLHEYIHGVVHNNPGITIETNAGTTVKTVFDGEVQYVFSVGDVDAVMVRHGKYFTTYSNLEGVTVTKGQQVKTGQTLGRVSSIGQLEFWLSDEKDHMLDPEKWLRR
jgi:septal ring factor EnvC (AmiA/AmiB activator)